MKSIIRYIKKSNQLFYFNEQLKYSHYDIKPILLISFFAGFIFSFLLLFLIIKNIKPEQMISYVYYKNSDDVEFNMIDNYRTKEIVIEKIKKEEGFEEKPYYCPANKLTIGYGHVIKPEEKLKLKKVTHQQADSILRLDFDEALKIVDKNYSYLSFNKKLALAHFIFCFGEKKFNESSLPNLIKQGDKFKIKSKFLEFDKVKIKVDTIIQVKQYDNLKNSRKLEAELFNSTNRNLN